MTGRAVKKSPKSSRLTWENTFRLSGLALLTAEFIAVTFLGKAFQYGFVLAGLALCGISIAQGFDRKGKD